MRVCPHRTRNVRLPWRDRERAGRSRPYHRRRGCGRSPSAWTLRSVPRTSFVPANLAGQAYEDKPLSIPHRQVTTQPSLVARMVEALALEGSERVLEVGAGYAWQTALLARLCGFVWAVERFGDVAEVGEGQPRSVRRDEH